MRDQDRLSLLPDSLLFIIISCLPFKEAVRTSILSRRWRYIPQSTRNMEFDERDFVQQPSDSEEVRRNNRRAFVDFIVRWIGNYQDSGADKFRLAFSHPEDHLLQMDQCIRFAIGRKVKVLDLDFSDPTWSENDSKHHHIFLQLPSSEEYKGTLESLRLYWCTFPIFSRTFQNFSALKEVCLGWVTVQNAAFIKILMEKCPLLEILSFEKCSYVDYFAVIGPKLKKMVLEKCFAPGDMMMPNFLIDASNLQFFKYSGKLTSFEIRSARSIDEAELDFGLQKDYIEYGDVLYRLLHEIASVKTLTLCSYMLQVIPSGEEPFQLMPALEDLKHLILKTSLHRNDFYGISFFLCSCPNLELLTIDLNTPARNFPEYDPPLSIEQHAFFHPRPYQIVYTCVSKKLKSIVVRGFKGEPNELVVLRYLLKFGRVLTLLRIHISKERAPDGTSLEETYVEKAHTIEKFQVASQGIRMLLHRRT